MSASCIAQTVTDLALAIVQYELLAAQALQSGDETPCRVGVYSAESRLARELAEYVSDCIEAATGAR